MGLFLAKVGDESRLVKLGQPNKLFQNNKVDTAKYNLITFLPKAVLLQFLRLSNFVFLLNAVLQSIREISSLSPLTAISPLAFVLAVSLLRQGYEDYKRHKKDSQINSRTARVLRQGVFVEIEWDQIEVGDYLKVLIDQIIPADILLLHSSGENSICYVETASLDGESNLKEKYALSDVGGYYPHEYQQLRGQCLVSAPCSDLYSFEGELHVEGNQGVEAGFSQLLLRQTVLRNTEQIVGVALYCGYDSKILKNQGQVHHKVSKLQSKLNYIQIVLVIILVVLCSISSIGYSLIHARGLRAPGSYVPGPSMNLPSESTLIFFTIFLMLNFLIPITLNIVIDGIKTFLGIFLSFDRKLYDPFTKRDVGVLNTSVLEELGVVDCILTDKTGTLTANQMVFRKISLGVTVLQRKQLEDDLQKYRKEPQLDELLLAASLCHEVVRDPNRDQYQGSSPDQVCLVTFADSIGYSFKRRTKNSIQLMFQEEKRVYLLIEVFPFSPRKRMSVLVRDYKQGHLILITKGADSAVFQRSLPCNFGGRLSENLNSFAKQGLRTLLYAKKIIPQKEYQIWKDKKAQLRSQYRQKIISKEELALGQSQLVQQLEDRLSLLGATGIEDRLQDKVPQTIHRLQQAGIKVMMVTGDKLQTAQNIGYLAGLIKPQFRILRLPTDLKDPLAKMTRTLSETQSSRQLVVVVEGRQIARMLDAQHDELATYCRMLARATSVIFCRSSPKEKALIVKLIKKQMKLVVLAIGDGGNDVGMIQQADVGVGIMGRQGNSASVVSDVAIGQFRFLDRLILHHGRWFIYRLSYFFIFFGWKNVIITFCIFFFLTESAFSGSFNYTQVCYILYNALFGICLMVHFALYDQDINDDLEPLIYPFLPAIYKQYKQRNLFSYTRYFTWFASGLALSVFIYIVLRFSLPSDISIDSSGRVVDFLGFKISHGFVLVILIILIVYMDTRGRSYFFQVFVFFSITVLPTAAYFIAENYLDFLGYYLLYTDYLCLRFWLAAGLIISTVYAAKIGLQYHHTHQNPTIVDRYFLAKQNQHPDLSQALRIAVSKAMQKPQQKQGQCMLNQSKATEFKEIDVPYQKKQSCFSFSGSKNLVLSNQSTYNADSKSRFIKTEIINMDEISEE